MMLETAFQSYVACQGNTVVGHRQGMYLIHALINFAVGSLEALSGSLTCNCLKHQRTSVISGYKVCTHIIELVHILYIIIINIA